MLADNRKQRRARERSEARKSRRVQKAVVALSAGIAVGVGAAGAAGAETIGSQAIAENSYTTVENLIVIADNLGRTQVAMLAPAASVLPDGWVPVVTSEYSTSTEQLNFLEALTQGGQLLLAVPDTSHVPGASTALSGISPQVAQALSALPLADTLGSGATVYSKMGTALVGLNLVNLDTGIQNGLADAAELLGGNKVDQDAGQLTGIPSIDDALGFWTGSRTTSNWTGTVNWLGASGTTWISQDQVRMDGITSEQLTALFGQNLNQPDALVVSNGSKELVKVGETCRWGICIPKYDYVWIGETDGDGNQVHTTIYDPNAGVADALSALDGIDVGGFTITQREAGGSYTGALGGQAGWLAAATQVVVPGGSGADDYVATVPVYAAGISLPDGLFTTGMELSPGLVTTSGQSVDSVLGSSTSTWSLPALGVGAQQTSLLESSHLGPDGFSYNSGWTIAAITLGDVTVPVVYSLGSVNVGPNGFGVSGPSIMGVGLPGFQVGSAPSGSVSSTIPDAISQLLGDVPTSVITLTPEMLFQLAQIEDPTGGVLSDPIGTLESVLSPLFTKYVTPTATEVSQAIADAATEAVNQGSSAIAAASAKAADVTSELADATESASQLAVTPQDVVEPSAVETAVPSSVGRHALPDERYAPTDTTDASTTYVGRHRADDGESSDAANDDATTDVGSEGTGSDAGTVTAGSDTGNSDSGSADTAGADAADAGSSSSDTGSSSAAGPDGSADVGTSDSSGSDSGDGAAA
jgi:hypothetical protein